MAGVEALELMVTPAPGAGVITTSSAAQAEADKSAASKGTIVGLIGFFMMLQARYGAIKAGQKVLGQR
jgi:hypothetical protein